MLVLVFLSGFLDSKLSTHLGEDKSKYILFKKGNNQYPALGICRDENKIKQYILQSNP